MSDKSPTTSTGGLPWNCREPWLGIIVITGLGVFGLSFAAFLLLLMNHP